MEPHRENIGIKSLEIYFPSYFISQSDLEVHDGVSRGKYTIGLGQTNLAYTSDREDIYSLSLTTLDRLLSTHQLSPHSFGRLEVGTETLIDKSKSVKSVLMTRMDGNEDIEGVDVKNACYGGTAALFNSIHWLESSSWDGRDACVIAADIAVYAHGPARPTGGMGGVGIALGPNAPLVFTTLRGTHMEHSYDFYKPDLSSEFPTVDGSKTVVCYLTALDKCYERYMNKLRKVEPNAKGLDDAFDFLVFHTPYAKLVQKSVARLVWNDARNHPNDQAYASVKEFINIPLKESYGNKDLERAFMAFSQSTFKSKVEPSLLVSKQCGNMYCPSVYASLISLLTTIPAQDLQGKRIGVFSYGSGLTASMFSIVVRDAEAAVAMVSKINLKERLAARIQQTPAEFEAMMALRESTHQLCDYHPTGSVTDMQTGATYLDYVDKQFRRYYKQG